MHECGDARLPRTSLLFFLHLWIDDTRNFIYYEPHDTTGHGGSKGVMGVLRHLRLWTSGPKESLREQRGCWGALRVVELLNNYGMGITLFEPGGTGDPN